MKILWLSNVVLSNSDSKTTGTWLGALAQQLVESTEIKLGNISMGKVVKLTRDDSGPIEQWIVPFSVPSLRRGLPSKKVISDILRAVAEFAPDIVHVWGTESYWGLLTARKIIKQPTILETQGLMFAIAKVFTGNLSYKDQLACVGIKEIIRRKTIPQCRKSFKRWGILEKESIAKHQYITVQTAWMEAQVRQFNKTALVTRNEFMLRKPFYVAKPWSFSGRLILFCTSAYSFPFKGLHVAIHTVALLKKRFPNIELRIAGAHQQTGIKRDGYIAWIDRKINRLGIVENVKWLGPLSATRIIEELQRCSCIVIPSFIEGYCLGLAEAMQVGVPAIVSFAGGAPCLAKDEETALYFPPGDEVMCAWQIERLLTDQELAEKLSYNARSIAMVRNKPETIVKKHLEIYQHVIA